ncbi:hypothetical protein TVAGG3_0570510 [Trichomonas vaginalis G3]|uniref:hypothetical protein n=1 Tax=Trichomonas vaginalis (strain ATCC PRA-98 / G3) TaxID=412133 RepID=UPI0021E5C254|nr:hypothetical protein TVAGG3_0570510 [Trichomonas vaginalis G3]KAI5521873.1 hypothetical protein TVAGG3_0570510 [Trichomonas vaginalis G3]
MYQAAGDVSYPESNEDRYLHLRQYYINQVKGEKQRAENETMSGAFKRIINDEPLEKIEGYIYFTTEMAPRNARTNKGWKEDLSLPKLYQCCIAWIRLLH